MSLWRLSRGQFLENLFIKSRKSLCWINIDCQSKQEACLDLKKRILLYYFLHTDICIAV